MLLTKRNAASEDKNVLSYRHQISSNPRYRKVIYFLPKVNQTKYRFTTLIFKSLTTNKLLLKQCKKLNQKNRANRAETNCHRKKGLFGYAIRHMIQFSFIPSACVMRYSGVRHPRLQCKTFLFPSPLKVHAGTERIPQVIRPQYFVYYKIHAQIYKHVNLYFKLQKYIIHQ